MTNFYGTQFAGGTPGLGGAMSPYGSFADAGMPALTPTDFDYMLSPLEQFRRAQATRFGGDYATM